MLSQSLCVAAKCSVSNIELVFAVDTSAKSDSSALPSMLAFVSAVASMFNVSQNGVRVALVSYSDEAEVVFGLGAQVNRYSLVATISSVYTSGSGAADSRRRRRNVTNGWLALKSFS